MKEISVKVGQIWKSNDPREDRQIKVLAIESGRAVVQRPTGSGPRTRIKLSRFKPTSTGYKLVSEA